MTSPSRRPASFVATVRSSAFTWIAMGAAAIVATSALVACGSDHNNIASCDGSYDGCLGWVGTGGGTGGGGTTGDDGGVVFPLDAGSLTTDGGTKTGDGGKTSDAGDGGAVGASCTGFASCGIGLACNGGTCSACGGSGGTTGPCPCTSTSQCGTGLECVANACTPTADVCHYQTDCASGDVCDDGQCVAACTTSCATGTCTKGACVPTPTGDSCSDDSACGGGVPFCVDGHCALACGNGDSGVDGGACGAGFTCDQGACIADTGPTVECTSSSQCTASGQTCVDNLCKFLCVASADCLSHDSRFPTCATDGVCRTAAEASPACKSQYDCAPGQDCIDNVCE